jgi:hypothetical protein
LALAFSPRSAPKRERTAPVQIGNGDRQLLPKLDRAEPWRASQIVDTDSRAVAWAMVAEAVVAR